MVQIPFTSLILSLVYLTSMSANPQSFEDAWASYRFLLGNWVGEGTGKPGEGKGDFSFTLQLDGKILVRKNHTEYPALHGRPAIVHDDLLIVYSENAGKEKRAIYFDNEGHVIQYWASVSSDGTTITFLSPPQPSSPRFRLTYTREGDKRVKIKFEIAAPGHPDAFQTHLSGTARRR